MIDLEPACVTFFEHWKSLRGERMVPTVEDFLDHPSPRHAPHVFMAEVNGDNIVMRLHGTALVKRWNADFTDVNIYEGQPAYEQAIIESYRTVINQPCGGYLLNEYDTTRGDFARVRVIYFPLTSKPGRAPRVVGYIYELQPMISEDALTTRREIREAHWIDIGAGVPAKAPKLRGG